MQRETFHAAIDPGTSKVCTLVARVTPTGRIELLGAGVAPSRGISKGLMEDLQEAREAVRASIEEASRAAGTDIPWAYVGVTGAHIESGVRWGANQMLHYSVPISYMDIHRAVESAYPAELPPEREVLHLIPRSFALDGLRGVRNPIGMHALRLNVETVVVVGATAPIHSLVRTVETCRVRVRSLVLASLASGEAVLSRDEREMGVVLMDIGQGTTDLALFHRGTLAYACVIPIGGWQFSNDLAIALGTPYAVAEEIKRQCGQVMLDTIGLEQVEVAGFGEGRNLRVERRQVVRVLRERAQQLFRLAFARLYEAGYDRMPPAGIVLTGGGATLPGLDSLARVLFDCPVRIGQPRGLESLPGELEHPSYATALGVLLWGIRHRQQRELHRQLEHRLAQANGKTGLPHRVTHWLREKVWR